MTIQAHEDAAVEPGAQIGAGTSIWAHALVRDGARVGEDCVVARGVLIDRSVVVGNRCKLQDGALLYRPAVLGDGVFVGPGAILTNDRHPRAVAPDGLQLGGDDWKPQPVRIGDGASIGAGATIVAGVTIGAWAMIGAGSIVTDDVPEFALVYGVPAVHHGWVGRSGRVLTEESGGRWRCPLTGERFVETDGHVHMAP
ncbi:MAG: acyltransferase [Acidimicrobiia bacterium]